MKWRQQECAMRRDVFISELIRLYGAEGYMAYNITLDILGENDMFDTEYITTWDYMARETHVPVDKLMDVFNYISGKPWQKFVINDCETHITIFCPNLIKYADEYAKKCYNKAGKNHTKPVNVGTVSGQCRDNVGATIQYNTKHNNTKHKTKDIATVKTPVAPDKVNMVAYYCDKYLELNGIKYPADGGKDGIILKRLLTAYGEERLKGFIDTFVSPAYVSWNGSKTVGVFKSEVEKIALANAPKEVDNADKCFDEFKALYQEHIFKNYVTANGDLEIIRRLIKEVGSPKVLWDKMAKFFSLSDDFVKKAGYTVRVFESKINTL